MTEASPTNQPGSQHDTDALRADIYRLLARLVREPPTPDLLAWLAELDAETDGSVLATCWTSLIQSAGETVPDEHAAQLSRAHFRHLVGVIEGEITPYASWYRQGNLMDEPLLALRRDLRRLGIARAEDCRDPEDHLAAICEVMAMLLDDDHRDEAAAFFMAHLSPWAKRCFDDLASVDTPFYAHVGALGSAFMAEEHRHQAAEAAHQPVRILSPDADTIRPTPDMTDN
ncbi:molecular chaperone TorD family protein [Halomonas sp. YLGW01]|uniref:TorD/DmsD family molecular chaperone n=1 Tax=Halomonas sp. YLGW01 TaxID=2773308 RepID=UPI001781AB2B|nr:molecular chaperone TorD family protein [Halomonas sp. YLGW01]